MKKLMMIFVAAWFVFPIVTASRFLNMESSKDHHQERENVTTQEQGVRNVGKQEQAKVVYLFATGYYHPEVDQDFYATDSYEGDLELNGRGITASGKKVKRGHVAVDPSVVPLGTEFHSEEYGILKAEDTGGRIKGKRIDIFAGDGERGLTKALKIRGWVKLTVVKWGRQKTSL